MKDNKAVIITLLIIVGIIVAILILTSRLGLNSTSKNSIQINGQANLKVIPDLITIYYSVDTQAKTSKEAENKNSEIVHELKEYISSYGFSEDELKTQSFSIYPEYSWTNGKQNLIGYRATHSLKIELSTEKTEKIGNLIDAGTESGAGISYINFELSDNLQAESKIQAIKLAAADARTKAGALAEGVNKKIGRLVSTSLNDYQYVPWNIYTYAESGVAEGNVAAAKESVRDITPSEQEVSAYVTVVYKLR
ncbi:MAG: SIMPL domain-containing protein [Candidatus Diapherotrites archaeon]